MTNFPTKREPSPKKLKKMNMKRIFFTLIFLGILFSPLSVFGGGVVLNEDDGEYRIGVSPRHSAFITYEDGVQKMEVSVETENVEDDLLWILPIPASPEGISIEISSGDVRISGKDLKIEGGKGLEWIEGMLHRSQIWWFGYLALFVKELEEVFIRPLPFEDVSEFVNVHKHLGKEGMKTEVVSGENIEHLLSYLEEEGVKIDTEVVSFLEGHTGSDFSFVVSQMEAPEELKEENKILKSIKRGIMVKFPVEEIHYPLSAARAYGKENTLFVLNVEGYVSPNLFSEIEENTVISYYMEKKVTMEEGHKEFLGEVEEEGGFTRVRISTDSWNLIQDLDISRRTPLWVVFYDSVNNYPWAAFLFFSALFSFVAGVVAGTAVSSEERNVKGVLKWGKIGLFNVLTIIGLVIRVGFEKMEKGKIQKPLFVILFSLIFVLLARFALGLFLIS